jgi:hypothetical protein
MRSRRIVRRADSTSMATARLLALTIGATVLLASATLAHADMQVLACGQHPNHIFKPVSAYGIQATDTCPTTAGSQSGSLSLRTTGTYTRGQNALWQAVAPAGLEIVDAGVPASSMSAAGVNEGNIGDYGGDFYWQGGSSNISSGSSFFGPAAMNSSYFGFQIVCGKSTCGSGSDIIVSNLQLTVHETTPPSLSASGLWEASGWVRGSWPFAASADSPAGVCFLATDLNGLSLGETTSGDDQTIWHQCNATSISAKVDTSRFGQGALPFGLLASDAASLQDGANKTLYVDNQPPAVTLSGPTDAPSTAGTQDVTATATAGPSGLAGISCSADGSPAQWYAASSAQVPVSGVGLHLVQCNAENNAVDGNGVHGYSATESFSMKIGTPTVAAVAFSQVVNKLRCRHATETVHIPARWVKVRLHGRRVRVREKAHTQRITVTKCHPRTARRRVTRVVTIRRHGKKVRVRRRKLERVVLEPRSVLTRRQRVGHGKPALVFGWLGTDDGVALGGQTVDVLTAADNGSNNYRIAAVTTTAPDGSWSARLPGGPSRLVSASYPGSATTEGSVALPVHLVVPANVQLLSASPRRVPWGGVVRLAGRLKGGYLPRGGALVRLRIGEGSAVTTYGVREHVRGNGRFTTDYHFGEGQASLHRSFWFQIASLPMGDYPYAPADSRRLYVSVGGHPQPLCCRSGQFPK